ncbi:MAG: serine/threonine-protein kinase [Phycisphaerae bacterium]|jgi:tRNA A-37 threonylcarbamoyl transferase component Bud32
MSETEDIPESTAEREERVGRVLNEYLDRRSQGEAADEAALLAAHPDLAEELREHLALLADLRPSTGKIGALVMQGVLRRSADPQYAASLGPYQIIAHMGGGGMGVVLRAYEPSLGRQVALKVLRPELAEDERAVARFQREAQAAAGLRHPNIVTVHAVGEDSGVHYMAMECIAGITLTEAVRQCGSRPAAWVREWFAELLAGLGAAHAAGLIHRDVKSSNILLDGWAAGTVPAADGGLPAHVKIADFGLARMRDAQTRMTCTDSVLGTPDYMSPEQARGDENVDHRADLYSAGVVLYEMLTGRTPFRTGTPTATLHRILHQEPEHPCRVEGRADQHLARLSLRLMAKRPEDRFASAEETLAALTGGGRVALRAQRRRFVRRLIGGVCAVLLLIGGGWWAQRERRASTTEPVSVVWVDEKRPHVVLARYGVAGSERVFHEFPAPGAEVGAVTLVTGESPGRKLVVAGLSAPAAGAGLYGFDADSGAEVWQQRLSFDWRWPDCAPPTAVKYTLLTAADLDGRAGDEVIAVARDPYEYPTRLSILDGRTGAVRATFWHAGELSFVQVVPDYFGPSRPAIAAAGLNNKLDGYFEPRRGDPPPVTRADFVGVAMVLDPSDLEGVGPPLAARLPELAPAHVHAYGFLDCPVSSWTALAPERVEGPRLPLPGERTSISGLEVIADARGELRPWFAVNLSHGADVRGPGILIVDRHLDVQQFVVSSAARAGLDERYWREHWHVLVREGREVPSVSEP